ncbi:MAG TPA: endonuclease [Cryomorphaceae bacterium]|nr:endonuclease [Cryomorphaceae bacterium]
MNKAFTLFAALLVFSATAQVIESSVSGVDFELVDYGEPQTIGVEVTNLTDEEVQIEEVLFFDIYGTSPFEISDLPESIQANGTVTLDVVFEPLHNINHNTEMIIKTSGNRGAIAVDLQGACDYPGVYYDGTFDEMDQDLKEALSEILADGQITHDYGAARDEMYLVIDNQQVNGQGSTQNRLTRAYLGTDAVGYVSRSDLFNNYNVNTEHTFPQGNFNQNLPMRSDIHHLFPTDVDANATRGSLRFGNVVSGVDWSEGGSQRGLNSSGEQVFEPRDGQKGLSARAILYFLARYQNYGGHLSSDMEAAMREWHFEFPPTEVDLQRNEDIFEYQNNRNPFADYPQMVHRIFSFRSEQDRPNVGELALSHDQAAFGLVTGEDADFNVVLANIGERFFNVSNVSVSGEGFSLSEGQDTDFIITDGESANVKVNFDPSLAQGIVFGALSFNTNLSTSETVTIPLSAEGVLGLSNLADLGNVLHPNPANGFFRLSGKTGTIQTVQLLDIQGREVQAFANESNMYPLNSVSNGIYLVKVYFKDGTSGIQRLAVSR